MKYARNAVMVAPLTKVRIYAAKLPRSVGTNIYNVLTLRCFRLRSVVELHLRQQFRRPQDLIQ